MRGCRDHRGANSRRQAVEEEPMVQWREDEEGTRKGEGEVEEGVGAKFERSFSLS